MGIFDVANPPSQPDSDLDSDLASVQNLTILFGGSTRDVAPGDWVDIAPGYVAPDPNWGSSYQVFDIDVDAGQVTVMVYDSGTDSYSTTQMDAQLITNNFRRI